MIKKQKTYSSEPLTMNSSTVTPQLKAEVRREIDCEKHTNNSTVLTLVSNSSRFMLCNDCVIEYFTCRQKVQHRFGSLITIPPNVTFSFSLSTNYIVPPQLQTDIELITETDVHVLYSIRGSLTSSKASGGLDFGRVEYIAFC